MDGVRVRMDGWIVSHFIKHKHLHKHTSCHLFFIFPKLSSCFLAYLKPHSPFLVSISVSATLSVRSLSSAENKTSFCSCVRSEIDITCWDMDPVVDEDDD